MKIRNVFILVLVITLSFSFLCCKHDSPEIEVPEENENTEETQGSEETNNTEETEPPKKQIINQFFWGTWQSMADGSSYVVNEDVIKKEKTTYSVLESSETTLEVTRLGTFKKQSENVIINGSIPYFRKGGTNLTYKMKLVGFDEGNERAVSSTSMAGYTVTGKSESYSSFESSTVSDEEGNIELKAPVSGDIQTVTVSNGGNTVVVVPGITVENNSSNMGTIPLSTKGQYSLKITGVIDEDNKDDGYLFYDKDYKITLTITNISDVGSEPSWCKIEPADSSISISSGTTEFMISSLKPNFTRTEIITVRASSESGLLDAGLKVNVTNLRTNKTWSDYVPLRFHKGYIPVTIAAWNPEKNKDAALNGFFIYPDGNSKFFQVEHGKSKTIYIPSFNALEKYKLAFSGAKIEGTLSNSTEMAYTVAIGTKEKKEVDLSTIDLAQSAIQFGESGSANENETTAFSISDDFRAYIAINDIDFYSFSTDPADVAPILYTDTVSGNLASNEYDYYSFDVYAGTTYTVSNDLGGNYISVEDKLNNYNYIYSSNSESQSFTPKVTGIVYLRVAASDKTLSYKVTISNEDYEIKLNKLYIKTVNGSISSNNDFEIYSFKAKSGMNYTVSWTNSNLKATAGTNYANPIEYFNSTNSGFKTFCASEDGMVYIKLKTNYYSNSFTLTVAGESEVVLSKCSPIVLDTYYSSWTNGTLGNETDFLIYQFSAYSYNSYKVYWADSSEGDSSIDTIDVKVSASNSLDFVSTIWDNEDNGYNDYHDISNQSGNIYIKVEAKEAGEEGSFRIKVTTN